MTKRQQLFVFAFLSLIIAQSVLYSSPEVGSTFSASPSGAKAIYLLLERLNKIEPERFKHPFADLPAEAKEAVLIITSPETMGGESELVNWIAKGGRVILLSTETEKAKELIKAIGSTFKKGKQRDFGEEEGTFSVTVPKASISSAFSLSLFQGAEIELPKDAELVAGSELQPKIFRFRKDLGELVYFSDAKIIQNQFIDQADNLDFLLELFSGYNQVLFDEFHHGFVAPAPLERESQIDALIWLVSSLVAILCLFVLSRSVRFGPPRLFKTSQIPPSTPFVIAIGNLFFSNKASSILAAYVHVFRLRIERKSGVSRLLPGDRFIRELTARQDLSAKVSADLEQAINELTVLPDGTLPNWARHLKPLERVTNLKYEVDLNQAEGEI